MSKDMKLILERFQKSINEQMAGITMPLNIGAATGAGKAAKAKEDKKNLTLKHNRNLIKKLQSLGRDPVLIELVEGDIKGISHPNLLKALKKFMAKRAETEFTTIKQRREEGARTFAVARNGSIRPVVIKDTKTAAMRAPLKPIARLASRAFPTRAMRATTKLVPVKMSPSFLADILVKILKPMGLV